MLKSPTIKALCAAAAFLTAALLSGCASNAYTNTRAVSVNSTPGASRASFDVATDRGSHQKTLVVLALSGGGSRASYWSASVMLALEEVYADAGLNLLGEVDVISSVSGGSLPAAYYVVSSDPGDQSREGYGRVWDHDTVRELMSRRYRSIWFRRWFWPQNIGRYWFTSFDRSDIMAAVFADHLFDKRPLGRDLTFADLNPERPYLIINATNGTAGTFAEPFTFTDAEFAALGSSLSDYSLARGVMASASFPAVFHSMTIRDFTSEEKKYVHVLDGGILDNLGLGAAARVIEENIDRYDRVVVMLVDAHVDTLGADPGEFDTRSFADYVVDENFLDSVGILMAGRRDRLLGEFRGELGGYVGKSIVFYHVSFDDVGRMEGGEELSGRLDGIKTDFNLEPRETAQADIDRAVEVLFTKDNACLDMIRRLVTEPAPGFIGMRECRWP